MDPDTPIVIDELWMSAISDPEYSGYGFKKVSPPVSDMQTISRCRASCKENLCGCYDTNWGCPPGSGSESECLSLLSRFPKAVLIYRRSETDIDDKDSLKTLTTEHQDACRRFGNLLKKKGFDTLTLADGGCNYCGTCSYPSDPCRFPDQKVPSISGFGIDMAKYLESQGVVFAFEKDAVTLYGLILYREP